MCFYLEYAFVKLELILTTILQYILQHYIHIIYYILVSTKEQQFITIY